MNRTKWWLIILTAMALGAAVAGFWGALLGPFAALGVFAWQRQRRIAEEGSDETRLAQFISAPPPEKRLSFEALLKRTRSLKGKERDDAHAAARRALVENPADAHAATEAALLSAQPQDVSQAIAVCLANGRAAIAGALFTYFDEQRTALRLSPAQWDALGPPLLAQGAFMEAAWALHSGALLTNDSVSAQKRLIEVASRAVEARQPQLALKVYQTFVEKYPRSQYAHFVRDSIQRLEAKLKAQRTAGQD